jgi:protein SCO1/2
MGRYLQKNWFMLAVSVILLGIIASFGYKLWFAQAAGDERLSPMKKAPDFELTDVSGKTVNSQDSLGKVRLVYFFFSTCPDVCLPTSQILSKVQDSLKDKNDLGNKAEIHSITIDPEKDTPDVLKKFAENFHAEPGAWKFLRGDQKKTFDLAEQFGIMAGKDKDGNLFHQNFILLVDKKGVLRNFYDAGDVKLDPEFIAKDVITLSKEK